MANEIPCCCWYCVHIGECKEACPNNPLYCTEFCAWHEEPCNNFELNEEAYEKLKEQFVS